ncbi:MgtC/SapB family protein [Paenibacillus sp. GD4]|uniref:MgtC/SapB family protein n=1 Tax=Paenibacillus sp. GD4 TaxID=3068890 RepID=UPI0027B9AC38|nr:MgtC/SapB family protein [Paenibacillus sp. GD4]
MKEKWNNHAAGFRAHILVCVGAALIMLLSTYGFSEFAYEVNVRIDPARLAAQVISGIGFPGAGAILRNGLTVTGLTTAASIWAVAAIGLSVGAGFLYGAGLVTVVVLFCLFLLNKFEKSFTRNQRVHHLSCKIKDTPGCMSSIIREMETQGLKIKHIYIQSEEAVDDGSAGQRNTLLRFTLTGIDPGQTGTFG